MLTFQSRFGRAKWLEPSTDQTVKALAQARREDRSRWSRRAFPPIAWRRWRRSRSRTRTSSSKHGGENFAAIPCLNDSAPGMLLLEDMARRELQGWV